METIKIINAPALDPAWLMPRLEAQLQAAGGKPVVISDLKIRQVSESTKRISILYDLRVQFPKKEVRQYYLGIMVPPASFRKELALIRRRRMVPPRVGPPLLLLPEGHLILLAFPNDRHLHLPSEKEIARWLRKNLPDIAPNVPVPAPGTRISPRLEVLRYVPGKRFTARCRAKIEPPAPHGAYELTFILKQLKEQQKAAALFRTLTELRHNRMDAIGHFVPRPLGMSKKRGVVFIEDIPGENLEQLIGEIEISELIPQVGQLLATLHQTPLTVRNTITRKRELTKLRRAVQAIVKRAPELQPELQRLFARLRDWPTLTEKNPRLLHGTFRINHIFLYNGQLFLLDLDSVCMGDPEYDVANFISSLCYLAAESRLAPAASRQICRHFLRGYLLHAPCPLCGEALAWYLADILLKKQAYKYMKHLLNDRVGKIAHILELANRVLAASNNFQDQLAPDVICEVICN